jgi:hypothetical protein
MENTNISLHSSLPDVANILTGTIDLDFFNIYMDNFTEEEHAIVNNVINILNKYLSTLFYNTDHNHQSIEIGIIKPFDDLVVDQISVDYSALTETDKSKINELINLILIKK